MPPSSRYYHTVNRMAQLGITRGCTPTTFCRDDLLQRWQHAVFIIRAIYDNCGWDTPVDLILAPGSSNTSRAVRVRRGGIVRIRLDDPQGLLPATETSYGERRAKVGVMTPTEAFHAATLRSRDPGGRELVITVPFDMPLRLWVNPNGISAQAPMEGCSRERDRP